MIYESWTSQSHICESQHKTPKLVHLKSEVSRYWSNSSRAQYPEEGQSSDKTTHLKTKSLFYIPV